MLGYQLRKSRWVVCAAVALVLAMGRVTALEQPAQSEDAKELAALSRLGRTGSEEKLDRAERLAATTTDPVIKANALAVAAYAAVEKSQRLARETLAICHSREGQGWREPVYLASRVLAMSDAFAEAEPYLVQLLNAEPTAVLGGLAARTLTNGWLAEGRESEAQKLCERACSEYPGSLMQQHCLRQLGTYYHRHGDQEKARDYAERLVKAFPTDQGYADRFILGKREPQGAGNAQDKPK